MSAQRTQISRPMVGFCALACLVGAGLTFFLSESQNSSGLAAAFLRVGLVMAAFWLALPTKSREAAWAGMSGTTFIGIFLAIFVVARYPRAIFAVLPILITVAVIGAFLRPRQKDRPRERAG
jgi:hypothetical protein